MTRNLASLFGGLSVVLAIAVLTGWILGLPRLVAPIPGWPATVPVTAFNLLLMGLALMLARPEGDRLAPMVRWPVGVVLFLVLWGLVATMVPALPPPGKILNLVWIPVLPKTFPIISSIPTLVGLFLATITLVLMTIRQPWATKAALVTCVLGSMVPWVVLMGYSNRVNEWVSPQGNEIGSAPLTTLAMVGIYLGIWSLRPSPWLAEIWTSKSFSGKVTRWVVSISLIAPMIFSNFEGLLKEHTSMSMTLVLGLVWTTFSAVFLILSIFLAQAIRKRDEIISQNDADKQNLIHKLEQAQEVLTDFNAALEKRINLVTKELTRSNMELQQFAYIAAHDLQAPLRSVSGYVQILGRRYADKLDDSARDLIAKATQNVEKMRELVNSVLDYSRVETKVLTFSTVSLHQPLSTALTSLQASIEESKARIEVGQLPAVKGDGAQLSQVFQNLVNNAIKYRSERPLLVQIRAEVNQGDVVVSVRDNGIGIEPQYHEHIFGMFKRLQVGKSESGKGIGLAICERVVQRHGGRLWVESEVGVGSCFYFSLPIQESKAA